MFVGLNPADLGICRGLSLIKAIDLRSVDVRWSLAVLNSGIKYGYLLRALKALGLF